MTTSDSRSAPIGAIGQIGVAVSDIARSTEFYRDALGLPLLFEAGGMAFFDCGGVRLMLSPPTAPGQVENASILYFRVPDLRSAYNELQDRGVVFARSPELVARMPDHELWLAFFKDPDGHILALMSEVRGVLV